MAKAVESIKKLIYIAIFALLAALLLIAASNFFKYRTIGQLLTENKHLKQSIANLTQETQIGYAKVISQEKIDGRIFTTIKFVETAPDDKLKTILEKNYRLEGDIINFDAIIIKFRDQMVMDGKEKAIYLWRRVYSQKTAPDEGFVIEQPGTEPARYENLLKKLNIRERKLFWTNIWDLANDPQKLKDYGIEAIYGNIVYHKLKTGLIYVFKITPSGQLYPEVIPDI